MIHHGRTSWTEPAYPINGPAPKAPTTTAVCHYSAATNIPADKASWLRAMQRDYLSSRGYSLGYWALVDQNGEAWQIRGPGPDTGVYNSAANKGDKVAGNANDWTAPILFATTPTERASMQAITTARNLWNMWGIRTRPIAHSDLDYTSCCGDPIRSQIAAGAFDNPANQPPEDDMQISDYHIVTFPTLRPGAYLAGPGGVIHLDQTMLDFYRNKGAQVTQSTNADVLRSYEKVARGL